MWTNELNGFRFGILMPRVLCYSSATQERPMPTIKTRSLKYDEGEEHILRRLGGALAVHWNTLPEINRTTLLEQAVFMHDRYPTVHLEQQIQAFIAKHQDNG